MKIETKYHGQVEVNQENIVTFEQGIPGFEEERDFIIIPLSEQSPFFTLQSVKTEALAFVLVDPFTFFKDYEFNLPEHIVKQLDIEFPEDVIVYSIVTVGASIDQSTANLQAPIVMNHKKRVAKQTILNRNDYHTKHPLKIDVNNPGQEG